MSSINAKVANANVNAANVKSNVSTGDKSGLFDRVKDAAKAAKSGASEGKMPLIIIIVITVLLFIFVILYITFAMKSNNLKGKTLMSTPVRLDKTDTVIQISNSQFPTLNVGREFTLSFWIYIDKFNKEMTTTTSADGTQTTHNMYKLIMYRGNAGELGSVNPIVMLDGVSNKLYVVYKSTESSISNYDKNYLHHIIDNNYFMNQEKTLQDTNVNTHIVLSVDYVPLQRWVNITSIVENKTLSLFVDGEIYAIKSTDEYKSSRGQALDRFNKPVDYNVIVEKPEGDLFIGKSVLGNKRTIEGYLGKTQFFNYALNMDQVKKNYQSGPMPGGVLAALGLSQYGFRAPVYKLNQTVQ